MQTRVQLQFIQQQLIVLESFVHTTMTTTCIHAALQLMKVMLPCPAASAKRKIPPHVRVIGAPSARPIPCGDLPEWTVTRDTGAVSRSVTMVCQCLT